MAAECQTQEGKILIYIAVDSPDRNIHAIQSHIETVLKAKKIQYETKDIATSSDLKDEMRQRCGNEKALAPQIFNGDYYCGDYTSFQEAVEDERVKEYLMLSCHTKSSGSTILTYDPFCENGFKTLLLSFCTKISDLFITASAVYLLGRDTTNLIILKMKDYARDKTGTRNGRKGWEKKRRLGEGVVGRGGVGRAV